ncbi:MAG: hypothetical protein ABI045_05965 [Flavobacteriales bacterium]
MDEIRAFFGTNNNTSLLHNFQPHPYNNFFGWFGEENKSGVFGICYNGRPWWRHKSETLNKKPFYPMI